ncbi:unnamed protein product [Mycena citricolor]|uniref:F-box domain-containing protein n=1 Tax=Mycena citricolor TaxID=2018698 RepID=A0AAD2GVP1_9AGAR|nr:unnamed protein product [Mycena citricolor]
MSTSLLSLPNELLIIILENPRLPSDALCSLAVLCRRLHFLALPIFFARQGMPDPSQSAFVSLSNDGADTLAALNMALFITGIQDLTCLMPHPSCDSVLPLLPHVRRLQNFIQRFRTVGRVTLQLDARNSMCNSTGDDTALREWTRVMGGLFNALLERRSTHLTIRYGGYLTRSYALSVDKSVSRRAIRAIRKLFTSEPLMAGKEWEFRRAPEQGRERGEVSFPSRTVDGYHLTSLTIQSAVLLTPPFLSWTLSVLRRCSPASLAISEISLEKELWGPVLFLIGQRAGEVSQLSLSELDSISDVDILGLCSRLPRLQSLTIGNNDEAPGTPTRWQEGIVPKFLALKDLVAPVEFILHILEPWDRVPYLERLTVGFQGKSEIWRVGIKLDRVCEALADRGQTPYITLSLALFSDSIVFDFDAMLKMTPDDKKSFGAVSCLDLVVAPYNAEQIAQWTQIFRSVKEVRLTLRSRPGAVVDDPSIDEKFLLALSRHKSFLRTVAINGKRYELDDWKQARRIAMSRR